MPARETVRSALALLLASLLAIAGCGGSSASYARFRRAAQSGAIVAAEEVRAADFIDVHALYKGVDHHWPTFNVADIAICVGVLPVRSVAVCARVFES